ncbi:uncharacterized protein [Dendrobates tinctorius]|uniref:uncharacterized protein n=1 Tax=Dendrobates tinctorius TaxID=92724 RepID=UPI003CC92FE8
MKDRFNKDHRQENQVRSGGAARIRKFKYQRMLALLRPVLAQITTWSSTLEPGSSSGAVLKRTASEQTQPSTSEAESGPASQAGEQAAGPSGLPLSQASFASFYVGSSRQRQKASDRTLMPEFLQLSSVFQDGMKSLVDRLDSGLNHIDRLFQSVHQRLDHLEADIQRPAHHFFTAIERGMVEYLTPELLLNVMQASNAATFRLCSRLSLHMLHFQLCHQLPGLHLYRVLLHSPVWPPPCPVLLHSTTVPPPCRVQLKATPPLCRVMLLHSCTPPPALRFMLLHGHPPACRFRVLNGHSPPPPCLRNPPLSPFQGE